MIREDLRKDKPMKITLEELYQKSQNLEEGDVILDVRGPGEFEDGHIIGAKNISHEDVEDHVDELKAYKNIYIHCKKGGRAKKAYDALMDAGLENLSVCTEAGMEEWETRGYSVTK